MDLHMVLLGDFCNGYHYIVLSSDLPLPFPRAPIPLSISISCKQNMAVCVNLVLSLDVT